MNSVTDVTVINYSSATRTIFLGFWAYVPGIVGYLPYVMLSFSMGMLTLRMDHRMEIVMSLVTSSWIEQTKAMET